MQGQKRVNVHWRQNKHNDFFKLGIVFKPVNSAAEWRSGQNGGKSLTTALSMRRLEADTVKMMHFPL